MNSLNKQILIVGGYGEVGQLLVQFLYNWGYKNITISGRNQASALALAKQYPGTTVRQLDATKKDWNDRDFEDVYAVVNCIDAVHDCFARACLSRGVIYFDLTAEESSHKMFEKLDNLAKHNHGTAILSLGLAPGLTNLLTRQCYEDHPEADSFKIGVMLGLGDVHGKAAIRWTLDNLMITDPRYLDSCTLNFANHWGVRRAYWFNFSDQGALRKNYNADISTYLALSSKTVTGLIGVLRRWTFLSPLIKLINESRIFDLGQKFKLPDDGYAAQVSAYKDNRLLVTYRVSGNIEKIVTAKMAAIGVKLFLEKERSLFGVFHSHQIFTLKDFDSLFYSEVRLEKERGT